MSEPLLAPPFDDLAPLPPERRAAMRVAADELMETLEAFTRAGRHPVRDVLAASSEAFTRWSHYPPGDVQDRGSGSLWFYHAHDESEARAFGEHGHFHCFSYTENLPQGAVPLALPANADHAKGGLVHLAAISFDPNGAPLRLFATNRWVTDEWMYPAADVVPLLDRFTLNDDGDFALVSRWLSAVLRLFQPQIAWLLHERDRVLAERRARDPAGFSEDESLEVTSLIAFDLDRHIAAVERAGTIAN
ncbi:MAG: hypothetical protein AB7O50_07980 [Pseudolabrys sp.]